MNKQELIGHVADRSGLTRNDAMRAVETMLEVITSTLKRGDEVRLVGFGNFSVTRRKASTGRNPRTGEPMAGWLGIAAASISQLVWRHPLAAVAGRAVAPAGATFAAICLITGSIWGRPTWGTWWEWDGRLTSMLILLFLYLGYIALTSAERERGGEGRMAALFGLVGAANLPIIHYSVLWWRTLHQGQSISITQGSTIAPELLWPLPLTMPAR